MTNTKLEQVEELVKELSPEDQNLLIKHLTQRRRNIPENGESQSRDDEIEKSSMQPGAFWAPAKPRMN